MCIVTQATRAIHPDLPEQGERGEDETRGVGGVGGIGREKEDGPRKPKLSNPFVRREVSQALRGRKNKKDTQTDRIII